MRLSSDAQQVNLDLAGMGREHLLGGAGKSNLAHRNVIGRDPLALLRRRCIAIVVDQTRRLLEDATQFVDHPARAPSAAVGAEQFSVIPQVVVRILDSEALPERRSVGVVIPKYRPRIVELVGK